jgi:UDP-glucuronate 4-epimerase
MQPQSILLTGGAGFIGSHLAEALLDQGCQLTVIDNFDGFYDPAVKRRNIAAAQQNERYALVEGDIRDAEVVDRTFAEGGFDAVIHLAARAGVRPSIEDPVLYSSVNLDGTTKLLESCRRHGVKKFIFGSSSSVYGNNRKVPFSEDDPVDRPISPYAATKKAGEVICHSFHHLFEIQIACLRFFTVYGPRQRPEMAIHKFCRLLADGQPVPQFGDGESARDYTFVSDIVRGILAALARCSTFHIWNLGGSKTVTLSALIEKIAARLGVPAEIERLALQPGDVDQTWADIGLAKRELDWSPEVGIDEGIERFVTWYEKNRAGRGR